MNEVLLRVEGYDLPGRSCGAGPDFPGHANVHVAVQRRDRPKELLGLTPGDAPTASWDLPCESFVDADGTLTLRGRYIQNRLGGRFVYLSWGDIDTDGEFQMFRRAKLMLSRVDPAVMAAAAAFGVLTVRIRLTDSKGHPVCAALGPPDLVWTAPQG